MSSRSSSSAVFQIVDLVDCICSHAAERGYEDVLVNKIWFVSFARTNKICAAPALRIVWRNIYGYDTITRLVPNTGNRATQRRTRARAAVEETENNYDRFLFYTDMIHSLRPYEHGEDFQRWVDLLNRIKARYPTRTLFTSLRHISVHNSYMSESGFGNYDWLVGVNAAQIKDITVLDITDTMVPHLVSLVTRFTNLKSLSINTPFGNGYTSSPIWKGSGERLLNALPTLTRLAVYTLLDQLSTILSSISAHPLLDTLEISLTSLSWDNTLDINNMRPVLAPQDIKQEKMLNLQIKNGNLALIPTLLSQLTPRNIRYTTFELFIPTNNYSPRSAAVDNASSLFQQAIVTISLECPLLTSLTIISEKPLSSRFKKPSAYSAATLKALATLGRLRKIDLRMDVLQIVIQPTLDAFAESLPNLEYCYLSPLVQGTKEDHRKAYSSDGAAGPVSAAWVSITDVAKFASQLPHLRTLGLTLGRLYVPPPGGPTHCSTALKVLDLGSMDAEMEMEIRDYASTAFPYLDSLLFEPWCAPLVVKPPVSPIPW